MARLRIKIELNPGGVGVRLDKLAKITEEVEKFLRFLASDCGAPVAPGEWLATDFYDGSFGSNVEYVNTVEPPQAMKFNNGLRFFSRFKDGHLPTDYAPATVRQFIEIGNVIDADEVVRIGLFDADASEDPAWEQISRLVTRNVDEVFHEEYRYEGALQGRLGSWFKDSNFFYLREVVSSTLIKCFYPADLYEQIYGLYEDKDAVVNVSGRIVAERVSGNVREMRVMWAIAYPPLSDAEFEKLFGLAPDLTGEVSAADFIERRRSNGDA